MASKCKIVNVVLNSNNKFSGTNNQATYNIDWGAILKDNTPYKLHYTYIGGSNVLTGANLALVYADFITSNKLNNSTQNGASSTQCLGFLKPIVFVGSTGTGYLQAEDNTNVPTFLSSRPNNNIFTITINDNASTPALYKDNTTGTPVVNANYVMMLSFRELDSNE